jgi:hypothetical protein
MNDRKTAYDFRMMHARQEMYCEHSEESVVALSIGEVISRLVCPRAAEIGNSPILTKSACTLRKVNDSLETYVEHYGETGVRKCSGDVISCLRRHLTPQIIRRMKITG